MTRKSIVFHGFAESGEPDADQPMDYSFWVARTENAVVLIDTGYDISRHDWLGEISRTPTPEGLRLLGIDPADVELVIATHFHYDHVGYIDHFPTATIVASRTEYDYWVAKYAENGLVGEFATPADVTAIIRAGDENRLRLVDGETEVFPGIVVYPVGGHCPGQLLTYVESKSGPPTAASETGGKDDMRHRALTTPLRRAGTPEEVAAVAAFLLSDDAAYMTGQIVSVDGGATVVNTVRPSGGAGAWNPRPVDDALYHGSGNWSDRS